MSAPPNSNVALPPKRTMPPDQDSKILAREQALRAWFTRATDPELAQIDGLDIGWGGVQRWATAWLPPIKGPHLDIACGYATFLAQLGWRFPTARLVGLNIDFNGPHALARPLLAEAGVTATLVQADARRTPFADSAFASLSCFLGLQDIEIGFGEPGVQQVLTEAVRLLRPGGLLTLLDTLPFERFDALLAGLPVTAIDRAERALDVQWNRRLAERAIALYAEGWVAQTRATDRAAQQQTRAQIHNRLTAEMESQLATRGYYTPFEPVRMIVARAARQKQKINLPTFHFSL